VRGLEDERWQQLEQAKSEREDTLCGSCE